MGKLPHVNGKKNSDRSVRVWRRLCATCGLVVDASVFRRKGEDGKFGLV